MTKELPDRVLRRVIVRFDAFQRQRTGVIEFSDAPACVLRIGMDRAPHRMALGGTTVEAGDPVLTIHLWNERLPHVPAEGASLGSVKAAYNLFIASFRLLAQHVKADPELATPSRGGWGAGIPCACRTPRRGRVHEAARLHDPAVPLAPRPIWRVLGKLLLLVDYLDL